MPNQKNRFSHIGLALTTALLLTACDMAPEPIETSDSGKAGNSEPTAFTIAANKAVYDELPFADQRDFAEAARGLVATADNLIVKHASTDVEIWNMPNYQFIQGEAPNTVNPSLWRQAKLNNTAGLYKVKDGIWQLRNFDLSTMSIIDGDSGWIIVDPGVSRENSAAALAFLKQHLPTQKPISAVLFTHSHIDHFGGILGLVSRQDQASGKVKIYAPEGFIEEASSENILLGTAMSRRAGYQFGRVLKPGIYGDVDLGLGKSVPFGTPALLVPDVLIKQTGEQHVIDGVRFIFQMASGTEAPAEFTFYLPDHNAFCGAEVISRTMHNVYTLRGAKVRDALKWSGVIDDILQNYGHADVIFNSHHWPIWGQERIREYLESQRDTYKFIHDQTVRLILAGSTPNEIAHQIKLPAALKKLFSARDYYGTLQHNAKAVYQFYMGWYDSNPANLHPMPPAESAQRYVEMMGGVDTVVEKAQGYYDQGEYNWVAQLLNHAVFAQPDHTEAKQLLAKTYDQLAYQAESGPWRSEFLTGAHELRHGITMVPTDLADYIDMLKLTPTNEFLKSLATRVNAEQAEGKDLTINLAFTDTGESYVLVLQNSVLHHYAKPADSTANLSLSLTKQLFLELITRSADLKSTIFGDDLSIEGSKLDLISFFMSMDQPDPNFAIVTP